MTLEEYRVEAMKTANWKSRSHQHVPPDVYCALKLNGEAGEIAEKVGKIYRDKEGVYESKDETALALEVGDVLWYLAGLCDIFGWSMDEVAEMNLAKLRSRRERNMIHGDGDDR